MPLIALRRQSAPRQVVCTHCARASEVPLRAMSIFCPHCQKRVIIEDFTIQTYYAVREFWTCGDILVERKGHVVAPIKAHNLTVKGKVQGSVVARGRVSIKKTGWFKGRIEAPSLHVESGGFFDGFVDIGPPCDKPADSAAV